MNPLNRRHFLQSASLASLGSFAATGASSAGQFTGKIRKAVKFHMIQEELSIEDKFKLVKDLGFDGTEIATRESLDPAEVENAIEKTGLPVHGVVHSSNPDLRTAIDLSKRFGGTSVLVVCRYDKKVSLQENWDRDQQNLREAAPYAAEQQIHLLVENVWASYIISAFDMRSFIDQVDHDWVRVYFDVGNNVRWGVPEDWVELLGNRIIKLDIKEYSTKLQNEEGLRSGFGVPIGEGSVHWANVREELAKIGFQGWATAEVKGGDRKRLATIAEEIDTVLDLA